MSEHENLQPLVQLEQHNIALLFANYLLTLGIEAKVVVEPINKEVAEIKLGHTVYCQQDKMTQARLEFESFIKEPFDKKYQQAAWQHGETVTLNSNDLTLFAHFKESFFAHAGIVTLIVFALCSVIYCYTFFTLFL